MSALRIAFAGDRDIAVWCLEHILSQQVKPLALLISGKGKASHDEELVSLCPFLERDKIIRGTQFRKPEGLALLKALDLDYIVGIHFPYIVPTEALNIPRHGVINLHPAFLPFNRGWHTPSWAILEDTPIGATLHFMDDDVDTGDIIHQKRLSVSPGATANSLYRELKQLEFEVFKEAWPQVAAKNYGRRPQSPAEGTVHKRADLFREEIQRIDLDQSMPAGKLLQQLRGLTTNDINEAAYFEVEGKRYHIQVQIKEVDAN